MYAQVAVARPLKEPLSYAIPPWLVGELTIGHVVLVPLGRKGAETGYVVGLTDTVDFDPSKVKPLIKRLDPEPAFDTGQLAFFSWIATYYQAPLGMVIHTATPSGIKARIVQVVGATEAGSEALALRQVDGPDAQVLREVVSRPSLTRKSLVRRLGEELSPKTVEGALSRLESLGWVDWQDKELGTVKAEVKTIHVLCSSAEAIRTYPRMGARSRAILTQLRDAGGTVDKPVLLAAHGSAARSALNKLIEHGICEERVRQKRDALSERALPPRSTPPELNDDQRRALDALTAADASGTYLLFGVTGAGKTEVFLGAAQHALSQRKQVLVLVPEIGLTPQLVDRFRARFGQTVAVLHSGLTGAQRLQEWRRIRAGEAQVAVGARSALFAPFKSLGLIVVDEEHDDSYKQDEGVSYSARDLAVVLGARCGCPTILATATPSLESWHNAQQGRYQLLRLPRRATPRPVPKVEVVDLTQVAWEVGQGPRPLFAPEVIDALRQTFDRGGKAIVLYNRRGYATHVHCTSCGGTYECPSCGISMTLHRSHRTMACHYCGFKQPYRDDRCPVCQADALEESGKGTERVQETLAELFPSVSIGRMDADTTAVRGAHHQILESFRTGETQLLVGTQIVAKGHDFPDVHTAVVVSADHGFRMPDFRAAERTYALLVQLAGRAGRGDVAGRVFVQTWKPEHYVIQHLHEVEGFITSEMRLRATLRYPPFSRLCLVRLDGVNRAAVQERARQLVRSLIQHSRELSGVSVLGPSAAALPKIAGRWRFQIILRGTELRPFRTFLGRATPLLWQRSKGVRVSWDVDPRHLM